MGLLLSKNLGVCLNYCALKGCNSLNDILTKYCLKSSLCSRNSLVCTSASVCMEIRRSVDRNLMETCTSPHTCISWYSTQPHVLWEVSWKIHSPLSASTSYTSYIHTAGKNSVHLNYFSLRALNQWVVLKQRIQLLKTAWESAWERLLIIDSF